MKKIIILMVFIFCIFVVTACSKNTYKCPSEGYRETWMFKTDEILVDEKNSINMKLWGNPLQQNARTLPICYNAIYDAIYYINYFDHNYIYRCKDGECRLVVEIPADYIYSFNGDIYFMVDVTNGYEMKGMQNGDVFKYSPTAGTLEFVVSTEAAWMKPSEKGIYFFKHVGESSETWLYDFQSDENIWVGDFVYEFFEGEEGFITPFITHQGGIWSVSGLGIYNPVGSAEVADNPEKMKYWPQEIEPIISDCLVPIFGMQDNTIYAYGEGSDKFIAVNLETEERKEFSREKFTLDFTVIENKVYFASGSTLTIMDIDTGEEKKIGKGEKEVFFSRLFNINNELYALCYEESLHHEGQGTPEIVKVDIQGDTYQIKSMGE